jgi:ubiquinone/menaquinone biosynthesis C-methylase UbiE
MQPVATDLSPNLLRRREAFLARSAAYERAGYDRHAAARFVAGLIPAAGLPVLDVGTGKGLLALAFAEREARVTSVDPDPEEQALAALLASEAGLDHRLSLVRGDAAHLPHPDATFAAAVSMDVLHHLTNPQPVLREMARVVRPGGTILLADFSDEGFDMVSRVHRMEGGVSTRDSTCASPTAPHSSNAGASSGHGI